MALKGKSFKQRAGLQHSRFLSYATDNTPDETKGVAELWGKNYASQLLNFPGGAEAAAKCMDGYVIDHKLAADKYSSYDEAFGACSKRN